MQALLLSNGQVPGQAYLAHTFEAWAPLLAGGRRVAFVPYGQRDLDRHTATVSAALRPLGVAVVGTHTETRPADVIASSDVVFVGGGNAFRLLDALYRLELLDVIRRQALAGMPYVGTSAGTNLACPTLRTTNDMPIVAPPGFEAMGLIPFQINPHYPADEHMGKHMGETRVRRIGEFLEDNDVPVVGLMEGSWLSVTDHSVIVGGASSARLFRRNHPPTDHSAGSDLSALLGGSYRFDVS